MTEKLIQKIDLSVTHASTPTLFHFRVSHYNEKVRWALDYKHWPHRRKALIPGFHSPRAWFLSGQTALPIIQLDGQVICGSNKIICELERVHPFPALYPADKEYLKRALEIEAYFDNEVAPDLRRLFWATYIEDSAMCAKMATDGFGVLTRLSWRFCFLGMRPLFRRDMEVYEVYLEKAQRQLPRYFDFIESAIGSSGYLAGEAFSVADLTAAAVMTAIIRPPEFSYPLPVPWPAKLVELRASFANRPGFKWVLDMYKRHRGPSFEI